MIEEGVGSGESKKTQWLYNTLGQKEVLIKPSGTKIRHHYDLLGRLKEVIADDQSIHYLYTYDSLHRVKEVEDKISQTRTKRNYDQNGALAEESSANDLSFHYTYDRLGRLKTFTLPDGSAVHYHYDSAYLKKGKNLLDIQPQNN